MPKWSGPPVIEVENLCKTFTVPGAKPRSALNRLTHPVQRGSRRTLHVLDDISFTVARGELFGIVGRNGSGKTTLLRILGSIYSPDSGRIRISGAMAPFIDLGVGFDPTMSARQNVAVNGVFLGLSRREVKHRIDAVLEYAEIEEFADVQLKNYSSGMKGRLAFASMLQADPDVYLLDEIFSAGDADFKEKSGQEFGKLKERGKTIVLVSHGRGAIKELADEAMLLKDGKIGMIGDPTEVVDTYRGERKAERGDKRLEAEGSRRTRATVETLILEGTNGSDPPRVAGGTPIRVRVEVDADKKVKEPMLELAISSEDGERICVSGDSDLDHLPVMPRGHRLTAEATVENSLAPGRYQLECTLRSRSEEDGGAVSAARSIEFEVDGAPSDGMGGLDRSVVLDSRTTLEPVS